MKLSAWAKTQGISYLTAYRWFRQGALPVPSYQTPSGTIIVDVAGTATSRDNGDRPGMSVVLYARVSGHDQRADLDRQLAKLRSFAEQRGLSVVREVHEVASGMNGHRPKLLALLRDPAAQGIVVEHRERLMRFGADYIEAALAASGRSLLVAEPDELKDDLVQDMVEVLTSFCTRLYGRRSARHRAEAAAAAATVAP